MATLAVPPSARQPRLAYIIWVSTDGPRIVVPEAVALAQQGAAWLARAISDAVRARGACTLALAGGTTPRAVYEHLASMAAVPWGATEIYFGDERCVPPDDPASNYRMARDSLLSRVPIPPGRVHRMEGERADRDAAARAYDAALPPALDVLMLGVGADGHTASLFPGTSALDESARRVIAVTGPLAPRERLTITAPVIAAARRVLVLVTGADKRAAVTRALDPATDPRDTPAALARRGAWIVTRDAAPAKLKEDS